MLLPNSEEQWNKCLENIKNYSEFDRMIRNFNILNKIRLGINLEKSVNNKSESELKFELAISLKNLFGIEII